MSNNESNNQNNSYSGLCGRCLRKCGRNTRKCARGACDSLCGRVTGFFSRKQPVTYTRTIYQNLTNDELQKDPGLLILDYLHRGIRLTKEGLINEVRRRKPRPSGAQRRTSVVGEAAAAAPPTGVELEIARQLEIISRARKREEEEYRQQIAREVAAAAAAEAERQAAAEAAAAEERRRSFQESEFQKERQRWLWEQQASESESESSDGAAASGRGFSPAQPAAAAYGGPSGVSSSYGQGVRQRRGQSYAKAAAASSSNNNSNNSSNSQQYQQQQASDGAAAPGIGFFPAQPAAAEPPPLPKNSQEAIEIAGQLFAQHLRQELGKTKNNSKKAKIQKVLEELGEPPALRTKKHYKLYAIIGHPDKLKSDPHKNIKEKIFSLVTAHFSSNQEGGKKKTRKAKKKSLKRR